MNSELFLVLKGTFRVPFRVDLKKDKEEWLTVKTLDFCFLGGRLMWIHAARTDYSMSAETTE